jgi:hypothetical protein
MDVATTTLDKDDAARQLAAYRTIKTPDAEERAIIAGLVAAVAGKPLVNLSDAIRGGGSFDDGCPRLAVMATSQAWCYVDRTTMGRVAFMGLPQTRRADLLFTIGGFPEMDRAALEAADLRPNGWGWHRRRSQVPIVPPEHRVRGWKTRCIVLWEVEEWGRHTPPRPPGDPMLLRHVIDDLYSVEAVWDLTPLEQMVLGARR